MTPEEFQARAIEETGGINENSVFEIAFDYGTRAGTFTGAFSGVESAPIAFPPSASALQAALCAIPLVGVGGCLVQGPLGGPYEIEMVGANAGQKVSLPFFDGSALDPEQEIQVQELQTGQKTNLGEFAAQSWAENSDAVSDTHRFLLVKLDLIDKRLGSLLDAVDMRTGQVDVTERKESQRVANLIQLRGIAERQIAAEVEKRKTGKNRTFGGAMIHKTPNGRAWGVLVRDWRTGRLG